mmetsp:Transcript_22781/g.46543  ORF Transcript_22781/g.46543 Transcript_22781/m.46543 type:complete len:93 (-) Transcript_22781:73-351(-)
MCMCKNFLWNKTRPNIFHPTSPAPFPLSIHLENNTRHELSGSPRKYAFPNLRIVELKIQTEVKNVAHIPKYKFEGQVTWSRRPPVALAMTNP